MPKRASADQTTTEENNNNEAGPEIPILPSIQPQDEQTPAAATEDAGSQAPRRSTRARTTRHFNFPSADVFMD